MVERIELKNVIEGVAGKHERADAAANRALILQTAERLFLERGVVNVCMAEIAEVAGVGKGTLYRRFANKGELCLALMDRQMGEFQNGALARFKEQTASGVPYLEQLAHFLETLVDFTEIHSPLLVEVARSENAQDERLNMPHFWQYMTVSALLRSAARDGEIMADLDLEYIGEALLAPLRVDYYQFQRNARGYSTGRISAGLRSVVGLLAV